METAERRRNLKESLIDAAEQAISAHGLKGLRARTLAQRIGCALGAIYNVVADLDELIMLVNSRTLAMLEREVLEAGGNDAAANRQNGDHAIEQLCRLAVNYLDFATANGWRWRAIFEHQLPSDKTVPEWYLGDQMRLFGYVEGPVGALLPGISQERRALLARTLFAAVHGIVALGLEKKLQALAPDELREHVTLVVAALGRGLRDSQ
jgi:AcrR family transcriptional regulator